MEIELTHAVIRDWSAPDVASIVRHANNRKVSRNLRDIFPYPYTEADAKDWMAHATSAEPRTNFAIDVDGEAVGGIGVRLGEDVFRRSGEIGFWLGEAYWGRGIMSEAVSRFSEWAFTHLEICRLEAGVFEWNPSSMHVLEKAGYELEGRLRDSVYKDGRLMDRFLYARLAPAALPPRG